METRQQYHQAFQEELARLNDAQRAAVDQIEGPVLVIAGPGTGKTHILGARIGRILLETDAQPQNILCLTFTDAGVRAMRERLLQFIGPEAHRVHIYTFHSFCNSIIQDNLELFGRQDLEPITELERVELIRRLLDGLDHDHPLRRGRSDPYFYEKHLAALFQQMKAEDWSADYLAARIDQYLEELPDRPDFIYQVNRGDIKKGDPKTAQLEDEREKMERLRAASRLYPQYINDMRQARRYDYDDMILWVLRAFEEHEVLLRTYQEQYLYFLVDEFQDTNGAQNEIVHKLIEYWDNPNIFIVGDDDQSIYEFQGARLKNLTDFYDRYEAELQLVVLTDNYRSSQHILDRAGAVITHNELRIIRQLRQLGLQKELTARHPVFAISDRQPRVVEYPNTSQEETDIVLQIENLRREGVPLEEIAVIYARHRQSESIVGLLEKKGIPYHTRRRLNILDLPVIRNLRELLTYLLTEFQQPYRGESLIFRILHFGFLGIAPADLARLSLYQASADWAERPRWRDMIRDEELLQARQLQNPAPLLAFSRLIEELIGQLPNLSLPLFLERLINRSGLLRHLLDQPDRVGQLEVLRSFFDFVDRESKRHPRLELRRLLDMLNSLDENRLPVELHKVVTAEHGVNLLTAHSAKGLEFRYVFLIDCVQDQWEPRNRGSLFQFRLPDTVTFSGEEDALEARRRLFYVAMTRAQEELHVSYSRLDKNGRDRQRARFLDEMMEQEHHLFRQKEVAPEQLAESLTLQLTERAPPRLPAYEREAVDRLLEGFTLSVSSMNRYLKCPLSFFYENVLRVPVLVSEAASYGIAMHNALERLFARVLVSKDRIFPPPGQLVRFFEQEMDRQRSRFSTREFERRLSMGRRNLQRYYNQFLGTWPKKFQVEANIRNAELDGVPITGMIDRLEFVDAQTAHILDYKTGSQNSSKVRRPTDANPLGGSYWRQLVFYKILYEHSGRSGHRIRQGTISYLEPDSRGRFAEYTVEFTAEDVDTVRRLIRETYDHIMAHHFYEGCGETHCQWCNFVRHDVNVDSFAEVEIEELDDI